MNKVLIGIILLSIVVTTVSIIKHRTPQTPPLCKECNVILISIDTFGAKHSSVYNYAINTTPFLEQLANNSIVFDRAYAQAPWTLPSHTAMFTGRYPWTLNIWRALDILPENTETIASALKDKGYDTVAFSTGPFVQPSNNLDLGFTEFYGTRKQAEWNDVPEIFNDAISWLNARSEEGKPFFLLIRPFELHDPYGSDKGAVHIEDIVALNTREAPPTTQEVDRLRNLYRADITRVDAALKDFFSELEEMRIHNNTIVIITSDHGEEFGEHGTVGFHTTTLYDELLHVPLIITLPKHIEARIPYSVETRSLPATITDIIDLSPQQTFQAKSLVPFIHGHEQEDRIVLSATAPERDELLSRIVSVYKNLEHEEFPATNTKTDARYDGSYMVSSIIGGWHAIQTRDGNKELYFINQDPEEQRNLEPKVFSSSPLFTQEVRLTIKELFETLDDFDY